MITSYCELSLRKMKKKKMCERLHTPHKLFFEITFPPTNGWTPKKGGSINQSVTIEGTHCLLPIQTKLG